MNIRRDHAQRFAWRRSHREALVELVGEFGKRRVAQKLSAEESYLDDCLAARIAPDLKLRAAAINLLVKHGRIGSAVDDFHDPHAPLDSDRDEIVGFDEDKALKRLQRDW